MSNGNGSELHRRARAFELDGKVRAILGTVRKSWYELAKILREVERDELWKELTDSDGRHFKSFAVWRDERIEESRSEIYLAKSVLERLNGWVPEEEIGRMKLVNAGNLAKAPHIVREHPHLIEAAKHDKEAAFIEKMHAAKPGLMLESSVRVGCNVDTSCAQVIRRAEEKAMRVLNTASKAAAWEEIFSWYDTTPEEVLAQGHQHVEEAV